MPEGAADGKSKGLSMSSLSSKFQGARCSVEGERCVVGSRSLFRRSEINGGGKVRLEVDEEEEVGSTVLTFTLELNDEEEGSSREVTYSSLTCALARAGLSLPGSSATFLFVY